MDFKDFQLGTNNLIYHLGVPIAHAEKFAQSLALFQAVENGVNPTSLFPHGTTTQIGGSTGSLPTLSQDGKLYFNDFPFPIANNPATINSWLQWLGTSHIRQQMYGNTGKWNHHQPLGVPQQNPVIPHPFSVAPQYPGSSHLGQVPAQVVQPPAVPPRSPPTSHFFTTSQLQFSEIRPTVRADSDSSSDDHSGPNSPITSLPNAGIGVGQTNTSSSSATTVALDSSIARLASINLRKIPQKETVYLHWNPKFQIPRDKEADNNHWGLVARNSNLLATASLATGKRKYYGHKATDIVASGSLQCNPCRPSNLSGPLLKIFRHENFNDVPQDIYDVLLPALQLATRLITDSRLIHFWASFAFGNRTYDEVAANASGWPVRRIVQPIDVTPDIYLRTFELLEKLGDHTEITFSENAKWAHSGYCYGLHMGNEDGRQIIQEGNELKFLGDWNTGSKDYWQRQTHLHMNRDFFTVAKKIATLKYNDAASVLRFNMFLASIFCHEIAHAFNKKCEMHWLDQLWQLKGPGSLGPAWQDHPINSWPPREPYWRNMNRAEVGWSWETEVWGGVLEPINSKVDASQGISVYDLSFNDTAATELENLKQGLPMAYSVPMGFVEEIQQESFWDRPCWYAQRKRVLHIPRTGAVSYLGTSTTTVKWRDHLNDKDEASQSRTTDSQDPDARPSKRSRLSHEGTERPKRPVPKLGQLLQPKINKYIKKENQDLAKLREEAITIKAAHERMMAIGASKHSSDYIPPESSQSEIHDYLHYEGSEEEDSNSTPSPVTPTDPLNKRHEDLTVADKWRLKEEYDKLENNITAPEFLMKRQLTNDGEIISKSLDPNRPDSWDEWQLNYLRVLRDVKGDPTRAAQAKRNATKAASEARYKKFMTIWSEMEELAVRAGFSRIEFLHKRSMGSPLPLGMSVKTWDDEWRAKLQAFRDTDKFMQSPAYQEALNARQAMTKAQGASAALVGGEAVVVENGGDGRHAEDFSTKDNQTRRNTIDKYFPVLKTSENTNQGEKNDERDKTQSPLRDSFEQWMTFGGDSKWENPPPGLAVHQVLSGIAGGSLRATQEDLQQMLGTTTEKGKEGRGIGMNKAKGKGKEKKKRKRDEEVEDDG